MNPQNDIGFLESSTAGIAPVDTLRAGGALPQQGAAVWLADALAPLFDMAVAQGHIAFARQMAEQTFTLAQTVAIIEHTCFPPKHIN